MGQKNYTDVLLEDMNAKFDRLIEVVGHLRDVMKNVARQSDLKTVQENVQVIKQVVTTSNKDIKDHEQRLTKLEATKV